MKKNCSKCKGFHEPPFGKYCHFQLELCAACDTKHSPPHGALCVNSKPIIMSQDGKPVSGDFPSRDDPKYLQMLEEHYLSSKEDGQKVFEFESLSRRLEALEKRQAPVHGGGHGSVGLTAGARSESGTGLGLYAGTGARPKHPLSGVGVGGSPGGAVRGGLGAVGGAGLDPPGQVPAAAVNMVGPLTDVLEKLTIAVDPSSTSRKLQGMVFKPEFYVQHVKKGVPLKQVDHTKLSYRELVFGWFCVLQHLIKVEGDTDSYIAHCRFFFFFFF